MNVIGKAAVNHLCQRREKITSPHTGKFRGPRHVCPAVCACVFRGRVTLGGESDTLRAQDARPIVSTEREKNKPFGVDFSVEIAVS